MRIAALIGAAICALLIMLAVALTVGLTGGAPVSFGDDSSCGVALDDDTVPAGLQPLFAAASKTYGLEPEGPAVLAGLTKVESDFGRNTGPSSAGAEGWTQFMPATWRQFGVDADGDGKADPMDAADAIMSAAHYLKYLGAPADWHRALLGYNHAEWYVTRVLDTARDLATSAPEAAQSACSVTPVLAATTGGRLVGGGAIVPIPGQPGMQIDSRILADVELLIAQYHLKVTAGYATSGHEPHGEHPLGLAVDLVPGPSGTWNDVDALAHWAEPQQDHPRAPFRWVGYDGDPGHGRGNHLHLSWIHGAASNGAPAPWVDVLNGTAP